MYSFFPSFDIAFTSHPKKLTMRTNSFKDKVSGAIQKLKDFFSFDGKSIEISQKTTYVNSYSSSGSAKSRELSGFASGGYPEPASLFWAGENGIPEILGTVGGKTAVAGGAEITGIRDAVYDVGQIETALLRVAVSLLETIAAKDTNTYIDGRELVNAYDERKNRNGFSFT